MRWRNATSHEIKFFKKDDLAANRKGQYFVQDPKVKPYLSLAQDTPLCVHSHPFFIGECEAANLYYPGITVDPILDFNHYDVILTSSRYSQWAAITMPFNYDVLDRIFNVIPLYNKDPETAEFPEKIGAAGILKSWICPDPVRLYEAMLERNCRPSLAAIEFYIKSYEASLQTSPFPNIYSLQINLQKLRQIRDDILKADETALTTETSQS